MSRELQNKLLNFELSPPAGVWEKIAAELDEADLHQKFQSELYGIEVTPPAAAWAKIATALESKEEKVISYRRKTVPIWKYAAAAALIGIVAFGAVKIISNSNRESGIVSTDPAKNLEPLVTNQEKSTEDNSSGPLTDEARDARALEESKQTYARLDLPASRRTLQTRNYTSNPVQLTAFSAESNPQEMYRELDQATIYPFTVAATEPVDEMSNRYFMMMTPDGNIIRMSKKWSSLVCCVSGEEQDEDCRKQLKRWREKMASSSAAPSSGNFMDILTLVNSLQEK